MLKLEWDNYEGGLDTTAACLRECCNELDAKEKHLASLQESVAGSLKALDLIRESVEQRRIQVETKEQEFRAFHEREIRDMESKWKELRLATKGFDEVVKLSEDKLNEQEKMVERLHGEAQLEHKRLKDLDKSVDSRFREISTKEKELEERFVELNKIQSVTREETDALHLNEREFNKRLEEFEMKEKILHEEIKELRVKQTNLASLNKELQEKDHNLDSIQKELRELGIYLEEFNMKEMVLQKETETGGGVLDSVRKELMLKDNSLIMVNEELRVKETKSYSLSKELLGKEHKVNKRRELGSYFGSVKKELKEKPSSMKLDLEKLGKTDEPVDNVAVHKVRPFQSFHSLSCLRKKIAKLQQLIAAFEIQNQQSMTRKRPAEDVIDLESSQKQKTLKHPCRLLVHRGLGPDANIHSSSVQIQPHLQNSSLSL